MGDGVGEGERDDRFVLLRVVDCSVEEVLSDLPILALDRSHLGIFGQEPSLHVVEDLLLNLHLLLVI